MPFLDHFHAPLDKRFHWESFLSNWATRLADGIAAILPAEFQVEEHSHVGPTLEIDVASFQGDDQETTSKRNGAPGIQPLATWPPPAALYTMPAVFPDTFEVRILSTSGGLTLVGAIELISPGNKGRAPQETS